MKIETLLQENRKLAPSKDFQDNYLINSESEYLKMYEDSINNPQKFWLDLAKNTLSWIEEPTVGYQEDWKSIGEKEKSYLEFFKDGKLNVAYNCLDRHLINGLKNKAAIHWQGEKKNERRTLTYNELHREVCKFASSLKMLGIKKGDAVSIFMPMVPELVIAVLACARIGAVHSVVFSAFSAEALASRIQDCKAKLIITSDVGYHAGKVVHLKEKVDSIVEQCPTIKNVIVYNRGNQDVNMDKNRDLWWSDLITKISGSGYCEPEVQSSEDPLFILYTSGSTGKPKGVLHTTAGYLLYANITAKYVFDLKQDDIFWCTADVGWITGHSYLIYGPLSNGATCVMFEGTPTYPKADRFWEIIEQYGVTIFYTAPTAIRALMRLGDDLPNSHDLSSLRLLGSVGEPINPEAWMWYYKTIGKEKCPVVDTWWQTETGGIMITTLPGIHSMKPGSAGRPFFGIAPKILTADGSEAGVNEGGSLFITKPWPGMLRGVYGDAKNELIKNVYFTTNPNYYFSADGARMDEDGYYWLLGRVDDVINVSAHRLATAEIESALVGYKGVSEAAVVGFPHDVKGQGIYCFVSLKQGYEATQDMAKQLIAHVRQEISPIATPDKIHFAAQLPKTRSGKIMRRILRKIAEGDVSNIGDTSTLADPDVVDILLKTSPF